MTARHMIASERSVLEAALTKARGQRDQRLGLLPGLAIMLAAVLAGLWALLAWLANAIFGVDIGWRSPFAPWIFTLEFLIFACVIGDEVLKTVRPSKSTLRDLAGDLSAGMVEEQEFRFVEAIRFQEPEHGGLMYFFLTKGGRVYVQFDFESQELGVEGKDPMKSTYSPCAVLKVVRAPKSELILGSEFSGSPLDVSGTRMLTVKPTKWPESDTFCGTSWSDLASTYAA